MNKFACKHCGDTRNSPVNRNCTIFSNRKCVYILKEEGVTGFCCSYCGDKRSSPVNRKCVIGNGYSCNYIADDSTKYCCRYCGVSFNSPTSRHCTSKQTKYCDFIGAEKRSFNVQRDDDDDDEVYVGGSGESGNVGYGSKSSGYITTLFEKCYKPYIRIFRWVIPLAFSLYFISMESSINIVSVTVCIFFGTIIGLIVAYVIPIILYCSIWFILLFLAYLIFCRFLLFFA